MSRTKDGGPAFPIAPFTNEFGKYQGHVEGMTLRDYFAAKAMQALIAGSGVDAEYDEKSVASSAYIMADVMLKAREA